MAGKFDTAILELVKVTERALLRRVKIPFRIDTIVPLPVVYATSAVVPVDVSILFRDVSMLVKVGVISVPASSVRLDFGMILEDGHTHTRAVLLAPVQSRSCRSCVAII